MWLRDTWWMMRVCWLRVHSSLAVRYSWRASSLSTTTPEDPATAASTLSLHLLKLSPIAAMLEFWVQVQFTFFYMTCKEITIQIILQEFIKFQCKIGVGLLASLCCRIDTWTESNELTIKISDSCFDFNKPSSDYTEIVGLNLWFNKLFLLGFTVEIE